MKDRDYRTERDERINEEIYKRTGALWDDQDRSPWGVQFLRMLHLTVDANLLATGGGKGLVPVYSGPMIDHFNHRCRDGSGGPIASEVIPQQRLEDPTSLVAPAWYVARDAVDARLTGKWSRGWLLVWRDITRNSDARTLIASVIPRVGVAQTLPILLTSAAPARAACLYGSLCSLVLDYCARQVVDGVHLPNAVMRKLPVLAPGVYDAAAPWAGGQTTEGWILPRVLELTFTAWDLASFARDCGHSRAPFRWDAQRRLLLRAELDAAFLHLYGVARDDAEYILDTFGIVRDREVKAHGEYRTKRVVMERYDAMAEATRLGRAYATVLDPPPADRRVEHDVSTRPDWA